MFTKGCTTKVRYKFPDFEKDLQTWFAQTRTACYHIFQKKPWLPIVGDHYGWYSFTRINYTSKLLTWSPLKNWGHFLYE